MIHYYAARNHLWTITDFIEKWAPSLARKVTPVAYDAIRFDRAIAPGLHLFTDFERLLPPEFALARRLHTRLVAHPDSYQTLSDPSHWSGRFGLLKSLAGAGINDFRAYRLNELGPQVRFPVFLRWELDHLGSVGAPVDSITALRQLVRKRIPLFRKPFRRYLMVVELKDVRGNDGLYRKYSAMKVGDRLIPRHVLFSRRWVTKYPDVVNAKTLQEERHYIEHFPDASQLNEVFRLAGLRYGRIDYGVSDGRIQVWEINTNPAIVPSPDKIAPARFALQQASAASIAAAFEALMPPQAVGAGHRLFGIPEQLRWQAQAHVSRLYNRFRH